GTPCRGPHRPDRGRRGRDPWPSRPIRRGGHARPRRTHQRSARAPRARSGRLRVRRTSGWRRPLPDGRPQRGTTTSWPWSTAAYPNGSLDGGRRGHGSNACWNWLPWAPPYLIGTTSHIRHTLGVGSDSPGHRQDLIDAPLGTRDVDPDRVAPEGPQQHLDRLRGHAHHRSDRRPRGDGRDLARGHLRRRTQLHAGPDLTEKRLGHGGGQRPHAFEVFGAELTCGPALPGPQHVLIVAQILVRIGNRVRIAERRVPGGAVVDPAQQVVPLPLALAQP